MVYGASGGGGERVVVRFVVISGIVDHHCLNFFSLKIDGEQNF
jgi:hypothetical protein